MNDLIKKVGDAIFQAGIGVEMPNSRNRFVNADDAAKAALKVAERYLSEEGEDGAAACLREHIY